MRCTFMFLTKKKGRFNPFYATSYSRENIVWNDLSFISPCIPKEMNTFFTVCVCVCVFFRTLSYPPPLLRNRMMTVRAAAAALFSVERKDGVGWRRLLVLLVYPPTPIFSMHSPPHSLAIYYSRRTRTCLFVSVLLYLSTHKT